MARVTVIGGGCIGLTTAHALELAGHDVRVIAAATGRDTTSFVAGAVWFPFRCDPPERVNRWSAATRRWLTDLASRDPSAGVDVLTFFQVADDDRRPWFADAAPDLRFTRDIPGPGAGAGAGRFLAPAPPTIGAWMFPAPRVEPALYLPWIESRLKKPLERKRIGSLAEVARDLAPGDAIINCTGLVGRALTGDRELQGVYGHVLICEPGDIDLRISISDDRREGGLFYTIPRRTTVVVGGCAEPSPDDRPMTPDPAMREAILERCREAGWNPGRIVLETAGLRPYRRTVRLEVERDAALLGTNGVRLIHNYGHGGAGYTMMWGCAQEVVGLVGDA